MHSTHAHAFPPQETTAYPAKAESIVTDDTVKQPTTLYCEARYCILAKYVTRQVRLSIRRPTLHPLVPPKSPTVR